MHGLTSAALRDHTSRSSRSERSGGSPARGTRRSEGAGSTSDAGAGPPLVAYDVWSWGFGGHGALGNRAFRDELEPYLVSELRGHGGTLLIVCGFDHTVAVTGDMRARAWGRSQEGQLGSERSDEVDTPSGLRAVPAPMPMSVCRGDSPSSVQAVGAGGMHSVLITLPRSNLERAEVYAMGRNDEGQLGAAGTYDGGGGDAPIALPEGHTPMLVSCGGLHSALVSEHGALFTWGSASDAQASPASRDPERAPPPGHPPGTPPGTPRALARTSRGK